MASTGAFLSALEIRPIMDVLWTQSVMPDNTEHLPFRKYIDHELIIALLTCGPVGFGDSLPNKGFLGTNVTKLLQTSRSDGVLLKPAHTALRLDVAPPNPGGPARAGFKALEVWAAAAVPSRPSVAGYARTGASGLLSAATDRRANSLARLAHVNGSTDTAERWWYTLLATDVSSNDTPTPAACAPVGSDSKGKLTMSACASPSVLQLKSDGSLRATGALSLCVVAGSGSALAVGAKDCVVFAKLAADGTIKSGGKCLTSKTDILSLDTCTATTLGQIWTTTDSPTGAYIEHSSKKAVRIAQKESALDIKFVAGGAWNTAHCVLSEGSSKCNGGHYTGGSVGAAMPDCMWNATVELPVVTPSEFSEGCKGEGQALWTKTGYLEAPGIQELADGGNCASICGGPPPAPSNSTGATITPDMLFPVPPTDLSFVVSTFGKSCKDGDAVSSCLSAFTLSSPLPVETEPCPGGKPGCRNWKFFAVAPVLAGGWAIVGEQSKYVPLSPQRIVAAHTTMDSTDPDASDALLESELVTGTGLAFTIIGAANETVSITVVAPAAGGGAEDGLMMAMAGKVVVVKTSLGATGEAAVMCSAGACKLAA